MEIAYDLHILDICAVIIGIIAILLAFFSILVSIFIYRNTNQMNAKLTETNKYMKDIHDAILSES